ncbi:HAD family hydrolase [Micromonospora sp. KC207]|uniref:HAD family hydrolase n=1 Tax=Micromonospora sp. KC207 TaxID=2530377 RepID=UPI0010523DBF|nr:HAD family hydrolase [Micromonospora sp. KC207]TDC59078.1 HAD family hydrolase [Micromonospora sp. KC207]
MIKAVVFDIGETLLDDTREWAAWADWIGVPRHTFSAVVGAVVASGRDNREAFEYFRPGFDLEAERQAREVAGCGQIIEESDLYPDVRSALTALRQQDFWVGIAGNQTAKVAELLRVMELPADAIATSGEWGVGKPDSIFFDRVVAMTPVDRDEILYVGDHRDYDIAAGRASGLHTALIRRGPWGHMWYQDADVQVAADMVATSLEDIASALAKTA